jgi:PKD repeat protein
MKKLLCSVMGIAAFAGLHAQCSVIEVPLADRVSASSVIVEGTVTNQYSYWNANHTMIYTANTIELYKIFKGSVATDAIEIITEGGTVEMDRITVEPSLTLSIGETGMFTCIPLTRVKNNIMSRQSLPQFEAYASVQGFVKYDEINNTASDPFRTYADLQTEVYNVCAFEGGHQYTTVKARPDHSTQRVGDQLLAVSISNFTPGTITAGTGSQLTINGSGFGAVQGSGVVRFRNADDGGATMIVPNASQYISWSNTQIIVEVPSSAGTGTIQVFNGTTGTSATPLTISYAHLNVDFDPGSGTVSYQTDHIDDNGSGGYTWRMNTGFDADVNARASFVRAFDSWRCATGVNWSIGATTSINDAVSDGTNIICYDNTSPLSAGILGVCYSYWSGCASGPTIIWYVNELDIIFDEGSNITPLTWQYGPSLPNGSQYDFETVAVHELGHGHQLGHVISPGAIMHYAISNGTSNRSLGSNDLAGGQFVQAKSIVTNICGPGAISNFNCSSPPVAGFTVDDQSACAFQTLNFTDQSTGAPTSWQWTFTGASPSSSTLQNPSVFYSTPGTYNVTLVATNASGSDSHTINSYITVVASPTINVVGSPSNFTVCSGQQLTLTASGAQSYNWSGGVTNGVPFTPVSSTTYFVTGTNAAGCQASSNADVFVNAAPTLTITATPSNGIVCTGNQATITASGASSYAWTGGITNGVAFTPPSTTTYTVTGTGANGCTSTGTKAITVQSCSGTTQLNSTWCGATNCTLNQTIVANQVSGATNYEFWFQNATLNYSQTRVKGNSIANIPLTWIAGLQYNTTYQVRVRAYVGGVWQAYGPTCNLTTAAQIPLTQLSSCAMTGLLYTSSLSVISIAGASDYEYEITNAQQPLTTTRLRGSSTPSIPISWFTGIQYGRTYNVRVRSKVGSVWSSYGSTCTFSMQASNPSTQLTTSCGATGLTHLSSLSYAAVGGATNYMINISNSASGYSQTKTRGNSTTTIGLGTWTGLLANTTYTVTVASYIGGAWGAFGPPCQITIGGVFRHIDIDEEGSADFNFGISMYPNPLGNGVNPTLTIKGADQQNALVTVMDLTGRTVATYTLFVEGDDYSAELAEFPDLVAGMYIMQVTVGDKVQSRKFIAE